MVLLSLAAVLLIGSAACAADGPAGFPAEGQPVEVLAVWQDAEAAAFEQVLARFAERSGAVVTFTSTAGADITSALDARLADEAPPDVVFLPQPGALARYAAAGSVVPLTEELAALVRASWSEEWQRLGSVDGTPYGVWFKAAHKSLLWYAIARFEEAGVVPPGDLAGLERVIGAVTAHGTPAFSLPAAAGDAWVLTDWFENLYLHLAGPQRYDDLAAHRIPWTDPSVREALQAMAALLAPERVLYADGAATTFPGSVAAVVSTNPRAAMVMEGDFVPGVVAGASEARIGVDVDAFAFPGRNASDRYVVGGGDLAVLVQDTPGGRALIAFLASAEAAEVWAKLGGFVSPNQSVDLAAYPDATRRRIARSLLEAGDGFRFDLSDLQPASFGGTTDEGLWRELAAFVADPGDVHGTMARLEAAASAAWDGS